MTEGGATILPSSDAAAEGGDPTSGGAAGGGEPLSGADRARGTEQRSFCSASRTIGVLFDVGGCTYTFGAPMPRCINAADSTEVHAFDLASLSAEGPFPTVALDDSTRYLEISLDQLPYHYDCDQIDELVFVARTQDQLRARTFGRPNTEGGASWAFDTGCKVTLDVDPSLDRLELYAFRDGLTTLEGPFVAPTPAPGSQWVITAMLPGFCVNDRILIGAGFSAGRLIETFVE